ncbi:MAG: SPOR domain-containing protein [Flaviramulus sp.]|nr:SPOR domain-containing protein [Flaviramulus sp.]NNC50176.1 SPOR domain-containing protein [Flaviramulus sp.]
MIPLNLKISALSIFCFGLSLANTNAQQGDVKINQDKKIVALLELKKEMNKNEIDSERYKIQVYNGNRSGAYATQKEFGETFGDWYSVVNYEPPNFKTRVGSFRSRLEADRALQRIKKKFPSAFIFKPKK